MAKPLAIQGGRLLTRSGSVVLIGSPTDPCCCGQRAPCECDTSRPPFGLTIVQCVNGRPAANQSNRRWYVIDETRQQQGTLTLRGSDRFASSAVDITVNSFLRVCRVAGDGPLGIVDTVVDGYTDWAYRRSDLDLTRGTETVIEQSGHETGQAALGWGFVDASGATIGGPLTQPWYRGPLPFLPPQYGIWPVAPAYLLQPIYQTVTTFDRRGCTGTLEPPTTGGTRRYFWRYSETEAAVDAGWSANENFPGDSATGSSLLAGFASLAVRRNLACELGVGHRPLDPRLDAEVQRAIQQATGQRPDCPTCGQG